MAELTTDAQALSEAATNFDGIRSFFLFEDRSAESRGMPQTEQGVGGMFASAGDAGTQTVQKLANIWGGSGSDAYQQTQQRWDSTAADTQYQSAADDSASTLQSSMGFTPPDDGFDFKAVEAGETACLKYNFGGIDGAASAALDGDDFGFKATEPGEVASLKYNFGGIDGAASAYQPDTDGGWLLGDGGNGGIPATLAEWAVLLA